MHRSGFIALVGRPNTGKSTLLNALLGEKVAIVSDKPQTTRNRIRAVLTLEHVQLIFIDTPGLHKPKHKLGEAMVRAARAALHEVDLVCFLVEAHRPPGPGDRYIAAMLRDTRAPIFLVLNKADLAGPALPAGRAGQYAALHAFAGVFAISALKQQHLEPLVAASAALLPEGPQYYPPGMVTDQPERFIAAEIIREKIIHLTREEIPFSVAVAVEEMTAREGKPLVDLRATIYVERKSQVGIVVGKDGLLLKEAGTAARQELEALLGSRIFLELRVKVKPGWRNREASLRDLGYDRL